MHNFSLINMIKSICDDIKKDCNTTNEKNYGLPKVDNWNYLPMPPVNPPKSELVQQENLGNNNMYVYYTYYVTSTQLVDIHAYCILPNGANEEYYCAIRPPVGCSCNSCIKHEVLKYLKQEINILYPNIQQGYSYVEFDIYTKTVSQLTNVPPHKEKAFVTVTRQGQDKFCVHVQYHAYTREYMYKTLCDNRASKEDVISMVQQFVGNKFEVVIKEFPEKPHQIALDFNICTEQNMFYNTHFSAFTGTTYDTLYRVDLESLTKHLLTIKEIYGIDLTEQTDKFYNILFDHITDYMNKPNKADILIYAVTKDAIHFFGKPFDFFKNKDAFELILQDVMNKFVDNKIQIFITISGR